AAERGRPSPRSCRSARLQPRARGALGLSDLRFRHLLRDLAAQTDGLRIAPSAAKLNHLCAVTKSIGTLRPTEYIMPRSKKVSALVGASPSAAHSTSAISKRAIPVSPVLRAPAHVGFSRYVPSWLFDLG